METPTDLQDWEFLNESEQNHNPKILDSLADPDDGAITPDYFSLNPNPKPPQPEDEIHGGSIGSDNLSWIDPDSDSRYLEQSRGRLSFSGVKNTSSFWSEESSDEPRSVVDKGDEAGVDEEEVKGENLERDLGEDGEKVWWRMPLQVLKVWAARTRPVWSISIAAAIFGALMLGRRLYKMKQRVKSIPLKIAIDDKKVSQFVARATRLNEVFSVVKRAPLARPSLPAPSVAPWPMAFLR